MIKALEANRRELLDLSGRNRLLSMPIESASARLIHAVGEEADTIYRLLVDEGKALSFMATRGADEAKDEEPGAAAGIDVLEAGDGRADLGRDTRLTTALSPDGLQRRLLTLSRDAQSIMEEQGVNILYLAIGRLTWYEANQADTPRHAPLLLVPVDLRRTSARARFTIRWREEDVEENLSLAAKLRADFGLQLPPVAADEEFAPAAYFDAVTKAIASVPRWKVEPNAITLGLFSFAKLLMYRDLDPKNWPDPSKLVASQAIGGLLGEGFTHADRPFPDDADIDTLVPPARLDHVVDADGSQTLAIESVRAGRNLVIQGPPGTGKSQTITNILATAALDGKRVLFVAEKLAALEVVKRRLEAIGLGALCLELHSHKANKKAVLAEIGRTWELGKPRGAELESIVARLDSLRTRLNAHAAAMHATLAPSGETFFRILGSLATIAGRNPRTAPCPLPDAPRWTPADLADRRERVADLGRRAVSMGGPARHPWRGCERPQVSALDQPQLAPLLDSLHAALNALGPELGRAAELLRQRAPLDFANAELLRRMAAHVAAAPQVDREAICSGVWNAGLDGLRGLVEHGRQFADSRARLAERVTEPTFDADLAPARAAIAAHGGSLFRILRGEYRQAMAALRGSLRCEVPRALAERVALLDEIVAAQRHLAAVRAGDAIGSQAFGHAWRGRDSDWSQLAAVVGWVAKEAEARLGPDFRKSFTQLDASEDFSALSARLTERVNGAWRATRTLAEWLSLNASAAFGAAGAERIPIAELAERLAAWRARPDGVSEWNAWFVRARDARERGLAALVDALETGAADGADAGDLFEHAYFGELYREATRRIPELGRFDGIEHSRIVEDFRQADRDRLTLAKYRVLARHYDQMPDRHANLGMTGVLLGELQRQRGHRPIRKLLRDAGSVAQSIKPIFMMSPLSVAQFLEPGAIEFDLLVIDEASQIPPVDAFGAFVRARQHVVVGDSKQLPPTRFFARITGGEEEEPDEEIADAPVAPIAAQAKDMESVLGLCSARGVPDAMLRWHYRSRHQSLIAVSNHEFYDDRLYIVPSPTQTSPDLGLKFRFIAEGRYDRGKSATNRAEAEAVCAAVLEHARSSPERTLGVAAFSIRQQQAILDEIERCRREHPELEEFHRRHEHEPFFVKNLESVQGDERDVIFISVGYGPDASGYVAMNFGPLSGDGGERRLNVLISRAKRRCVVFTSIRAADIDLARAGGRGVAAFKSFLQFAETGVLGVAAPTDREEGSPFETAVRAAIVALGHSVDAQVGVSGFFIDLAVVDPGKPGRYLLGIECDGAAYHSSRSARDRDRLRQAVLEDHGWTIHRIWSTDWFQRPKDELAKVMAAIERAKARAAESDAAPTSPPPPPAPKAPEIARDADDAAVENVASISVPYVEATCDHVLPGELHEVPPAKMAEVVLLVVRCESPIHVDEVVTRVRGFWGLKRSGSRIEEAVGNGIDALVASRRCTRDGDFLSLAGAPAIVRDRSEVRSAGLRSIERIAGVEMRAGIGAAAVALVGASEGDLALAVARALGFKAMSGNVRERLLEEIRAMVREGSLREDGAVLRPASAT